MESFFASSPLKLSLYNRLLFWILTMCQLRLFLSQDQCFCQRWYRICVGLLHHYFDNRFTQLTGSSLQFIFNAIYVIRLKKFVNSMTSCYIVVVSMEKNCTPLKSYSSQLGHHVSSGLPLFIELGVTIIIIIITIIIMLALVGRFPQQ